MMWLTRVCMLLVRPVTGHGGHRRCQAPGDLRLDIHRFHHGVTPGFYLWVFDPRPDASLGLGVAENFSGSKPDGKIYIIDATAYLGVISIMKVMMTAATKMMNIII